MDSMKNTLDFLLTQIAILKDDADSRDADFVSYKTSHNIIDIKFYAIKKLAQEKAVLLSLRTGINDFCYGIACFYDDEPYLVHDVAFEDFIDVLNLSNSALATAIKNCNTEHRSKILAYLENKCLDKLITSQATSNHLGF